MLQSVARPKIRDVIAAQLRSYISQANLQPGDRLPTESQLAAQFGVSRLSLREATKALEYVGLVEAKPGRGLTVGTLNLARVAGCLEFDPVIQVASSLELIQTRVIIETGVLPYVSQRMQSDPAIHAELHEIDSQLQRARLLKEWIELDIAFHRRLVESSGLTTLLAFADVLAVFFRRFRESVQVKKSQWMSGLRQHELIIDELQAGNVAAADAALRAHIESHQGHLLKDQT